MTFWQPTCCKKKEEWIERSPLPSLFRKLLVGIEQIKCMYQGYWSQGGPWMTSLSLHVIQVLAVPGCLSPALHLYFTSLLNYFNYTLVGSVYLYVSIFFFSLLVWQGVSTSRKNAEEPKIATCGCQVTAGYAVFFIRFHLLIADTEAAEIYAHKTALMKTLWVTACTVFNVRVCIRYPMLHASSCLIVRSIQKVLVLCITTTSWELFVCYCKVFRCASDYMDWAPPHHLSSKAQRYDSTEAQQSSQQTFRGPHCRLITVITVRRIN